jgi:hypothetical protein
LLLAAKNLDQKRPHARSSHKRSSLKTQRQQSKTGICTGFPLNYVWIFLAPSRLERL